jgi:hypothetical protein
LNRARFVFSHFGTAILPREAAITRALRASSTIRLSGATIARHIRDEVSIGCGARTQAHAIGHLLGMK